LIEQKVVRVSRVRKETAYRFKLEDGRSFSATAEHVCFASLDDPGGAYLYLMYRPDLGFRIGVSRTPKGKHLHMRTLQEHAQRLWTLGWFATYEEAAAAEAANAYRFGVPREPFNPRAGMWSGTAEATKRLFAQFGANGAKVLEAFGADFERPNYFCKASSRGRRRIAVNLLVAGMHHRRPVGPVEIETEGAAQGAAKALGMQWREGEGTFRKRAEFPSYRAAKEYAGLAAEELGGYVVEHLSGTPAQRRCFATRAATVNRGMLVPVVDRGGRARMIRV